jgi:hypothetical protein
MPLSWEYVELVRRYSNRVDLRERLAEVQRRLGQSDADEPDDPALTVGGQVVDPSHGRGRLTDADEAQLIADFLAGATRQVLADRYVVSMSTVQRILRKHGVRRRPEPRR